MRARDRNGREALFAVTGVAVGMALGAWIAKRGDAPDSPQEIDAAISPKGDASALEVDEGSARLASPSAARANAGPREPGVVEAAIECPLFGATQRAYGEQGIREGWKLGRKDEPDEAGLTNGLATYEGLVRDSPRSIGRQLSAKRSAAEAALADAARGGLFALLSKLNDGDVGPLVDEVRDDARMAKYFARSSAGSNVVDGATHRHHPDKELEDGATLSFPGGVYLLENLMEDKDPFPRDVTVSGAGSDGTMLVLANTLDTRGELVNLTLRDCTIHTNGHTLFDLRSKPASVTCERVRFVGFDVGAGCSCLFATEALAVRAIDCEILGGYGSAPEHGLLLDVRTDALLARFERCRIDEIQLRVDLWRPGATLVFVGCALTDLIDARPIESFHHAGVVLDGCSVSYLPNGWQGAVKKDLNALFPNWAQRLVR